MQIISPTPRTCSTKEKHHFLHAVKKRYHQRCRLPSWSDMAPTWCAINAAEDDLQRLLVHNVTTCASTQKKSETPCFRHVRNAVCCGAQCLTDARTRCHAMPSVMSSYFVSDRFRVGWLALSHSKMFLSLSDVIFILLACRSQHT